MICQHCQTKNREFANYCKECGSLLTATCPNCGSDLPEASKFCDICGQNLSQPAITPHKPVERSRPSASTISPKRAAQSHLHQYIPEELLAKLEAAESAGGMQGERRVVTILFCDLKGSTSAAEFLDPEDWSDIVNGAFEHMIAPVYRYEGTVARLMGDGILAFFGAPIAHEDDAMRAVLAGLDIVSSTETYRQEIQQRYDVEIDVRVGINTGRVVVGAVGSDLRLEYTAIGDAINLAARMEQTAEPGTVQIAEDSHKLVAPLFEIKEIGTIQVKGRAEPVAAYQVIGRKEKPGRLRGISGLESPLIGRDNELNGLVDAMTDLRLGRGQILYLIAQAGLGKSRLIREWYQLWQGDDTINQEIAFWLLRPVSSYQASEPYRLLKNLYYLIFEINEGMPPAQISDTLRRAIDGFGTRGRTQGMPDQAFSALSKLLGLQPDKPEEMSLQGEVFKQQLLSTTTATIRHLAQKQPLILALDDLHWADPASLEAIEHLFQLVDSVPLLFLCAMRPDTNAPSWDLQVSAEKEYRHRYSETILRPLSKEDSLALFNCLLPRLSWPERFRELVLEKSEGIPFFIEEVVRTLIDDAIVQKDDNEQWVITSEVEDFIIPANLQALLAARFDRLSEKNRDVLQKASVIGRYFDYDILQKISSNGGNLENALAELQRSEIIIEEARIPKRLFRFRNSLAQDTVYHSMLRKNRREYHSRVAEALLNQEGDQEGEQLAAVAYHFFQAQDNRALIYNQRAGEVAFQLFANREAATYYGRAVDMTRKGTSTSPDLLTKIYSRFGRVHELMSQFSEALEIYQEMHQLAVRLAEPEMKLAALVSIGTIYSTANDRFDAAAGEKIADEAISLANELEDEAAEAKILWNLLNLYRLSERPPKALVVGERSLELARKNNLEEQLAYSANDMTHVYMANGMPEKASQVIEEATHLWRKLGNQPMLADSLATAGMVYGMQGKAEIAIEKSDEAFSISMKIENLWGQSYSRFFVGHIYWYIGQPDQSIQTIKQCVEIGAKAGFLPSQIYNKAYLALFYAYLGEFDHALPLIKEALSLAEDIMPYYRPPTLSLLGQIYHLAGEQKLAKEVYDEVVTFDIDLEPLLRGSIEAFKTLYNLRQGEGQLALKSASSFLEIQRGFGVRTLLPEALMLLGQTYLLIGDLDRAANLLAESRAESQELGYQWQLWQTLAATARLEQKRGNQEVADRHLTQATEIFAEIAGNISAKETRFKFEQLSYWKDQLEL